MTHHRQFENFIRNGSHLPQVDFDSASFKDQLKKVMAEEHNKEYYSRVNFLVPKYDIDGLLKLYSKYSQLKCFEMITEIVSRRFHREFYEGLFDSYSYEKQSQLLKDIEAFVKDKFGKDNDLEKTARYV